MSQSAIESHFVEPFAALLTPRGRGAVATICVRGDCGVIDASSPRPLFRAANGRPLGEQPVGRVVFGHWGGDVPEEVVACRVDLQTLEIHCHGGDAAVRRILGDLERAGFAIETWSKLFEHAHGIFETECAEALSRATTARTAFILLAQQTGVFRGSVERLRRESALSGADGNSDSTDTRERRSMLIRQIDEWLRWSEFGRHLTEPWRVVLAGRPNVGKSSLINALVGYSRSIVFDQPGTTRDVVTVETALDGWPIQMADTAGIRVTDESLESEGILRARKMVAEADCRILLVDVGSPPTEGDFALLADWPDSIVVAHKCDLPDAWGERLPDEARHVSSLRGTGVDDLAAELVARLVPTTPPSEMLVPFTERQVALLRSARDSLGRDDAVALRRALDELLS